MTICLRAAGIWISDDHILLESLADRELWGIPGGGVEPGESVWDACLREYFEETGVTLVRQRLAIIHENFWNDAGQAIREYCFYFLVNPVEELGQQPTVSSIEGHLKFNWTPLAELQNIEFVPQELLDNLTDLPGETIFISSWDEK